MDRLRESLKRALRVGYRIAARRVLVPSRYGSRGLTETSKRILARIELARLPDLGYDESTIRWAERLLREGNSTAPFPVTDPVESQSDTVRLRGLFAYLSQLHRFMEPALIEARLAILLQTTVGKISSNSGIGWDTTNAALRLLSFLEGTEHLSHTDGGATVRALLPDRFLEAHSRALLAGSLIEPRGNHEALNALGFAALDMLLRPWTPLSEHRIRHVERVFARQILPDGGHVERCPHYHLQVLSALNAILAANARRGGILLGALGELHDRLQAALSAMVIPSAAVPARFGDISRTWSGLRVDEDVRRALGPSWSPETVASAFLPDSGVIRACWLTRGRRVDLVANVGPFGLTCNTGHAHDDCLSYCVYVDGIELIADPGVFRYADDPASIWFKLARAHNTIRWADAPGPVARRFFHWRCQPSMEHLTVWGSPSTNSIRARRRAYCRGIGYFSHCRTWRLNSEGFTVRDYIRANRHGPCIARINVGPRCQLKIHAHGEDIVLLDGRVPCLRVRWRAPVGVRVSRATSRYAAQYGEVTPSEAMEWWLPHGTYGSWIEVGFELL